jgi:hypothetical protein
LLALRDASNSADYDQQKKYADALVEIRSNGPFSTTSPVSMITENPDVWSGEKILMYDGYNHFTEEKKVIEFLYPDGFQNTNLRNRAILCSLNENVDKWNEKIQELNLNQIHELRSDNILDDVDDPHSNLRSMLNDNSLQFWEKPGVPLHLLKLKIGDICFLVRNVSKKDQLNKNTRVKILAISRYRVQIETLVNPKVYVISRQRFKITHSIGFTIVRTQFPLQLAYAMTKNKAQGQGLEWSVNDIREPSFTHGQEYVALSRPFRFDQVAIFCNPDQSYEGKVCISNVVYNELLDEKKPIIEEEHEAEQRESYNVEQQENYDF